MAAACDRPVPVALNAPPPTPYAALYQYPPLGAARYPLPVPSPQTQSAALSQSAQATITDKKGEAAATIQLDTIQVNADGQGSATVCHKSERGPTCNLWTFDCNYLAEGQFAHSNYFPAFMHRQNGPPLTPEQNAELDALDAIATKLPPAACRRSGHVAQTAQWREVRNDAGEVKATIDVATIMRDADGNSHARICLNSTSEAACPAGNVILRWYINCRTHQYSWLDTSVMPGLPREMNNAQPNSVADQLATIACR